MQKSNTNTALTTESNDGITLLSWPVHSVQALQTTRSSSSLSSSNAPYDNFNLGLHVGDDETSVNLNRNFLEQNFLDQKKIQWLEQVHGNHAEIITELSTKPLVADACITSNRDIALAIMTADCLPILLSNESGSIVAAIHGGWRSLAGGIINNTLTKMAEPPRLIYAWLGPCIGKRAFEVGLDVYESFTSQSSCFRKAFKLQKSGKYLADLHHIATIQLNRLGVERIDTLEECTYDNANKYYSYRREALTGRMASIICRR